MDAKQEHDHKWEIDYSAPVRTVHPPIYAVTCLCGATADMQSGTVRNITAAINN